MAAPETRPFAPEANRQIFDTLFAVEVGLRELIIETLETDIGPKWFKQLPADVREKAHAGRDSQRRAEWTTYVDHHPLYYIDFPDLGKVIASKWNTHFSKFFSDKTILLASLRQLEPIRNKIAHNRKATDADLTQVAAVRSVLEAEIGMKRFETLLSRSTTAPPLTQIFERLLHEIRQSAAIVSAVAAPAPLEVWPSVCDEWWFDSEFLLPRPASTTRRAPTPTAEPEPIPAVFPENSSDSPGHRNDAGLLSCVSHFFELYREYASQPRGRGMGHLLERWAKENSVSDAAQQATQAIETIRQGEHHDQSF